MLDCFGCCSIASVNFRSYGNITANLIDTGYLGDKKNNNIPEIKREAYNTHMITKTRSYLPISPIILFTVNINVCSAVIIASQRKEIERGRSKNSSSLLKRQQRWQVVA